MTTGEKIRKRRLELNMTMEELGNAIGVQRSAINKYEKGFVDIKSKTLMAISKALLVPVSELLDDDPAGNAGFEDELMQELTKLLADLSPDQKRQALNVLRAMFSDNKEWL